MSALRVGVIGAGMIAAIHVDAIRRCPLTELAGVMDRGSGKGRALAPECSDEGHDDIARFVDVVHGAMPEQVEATAFGTVQRHSLVFHSDINLPSSSAVAASR